LASETALGRFPNITVWGRKGSFIRFGTDVQEPTLVQGMKPNAPGFGRDRPEDHGILCLSTHQGTTEEKVPTEKGDYGFYFDNVYQAITAGKELAVTPEQGAVVLRLLELASQSALEKRRIPVDRIELSSLTGRQ